ncbi:hypothetical protein NUW54_g4014 [Trametes sanguinea]|uniref:Uncharacterized protein n=1 Tax=Trametes sanguinea TaxID=158606 RepID=A0ACC1PZ55_9APHY|nr:hypothetical protein NUW54_g4014 [Trametes sanguinea]
MLDCLLRGQFVRAPDTHTHPISPSPTEDGAPHDLPNVIAGTAVQNTAEDPAYTYNPTVAVTSTAASAVDVAPPVLFATSAPTTLGTEAG